MRALLVIISALLAANVNVNAAAAQPVDRAYKIMAVGDSNTWLANYRLELKKLLAAAKIDHDFVGRIKSSQFAKDAQPVEKGLFVEDGQFEDNENEGYRGEGIVRIQTRIKENFLEIYKPDIVLLMVGANDMWVSLGNRVPIGDDKARFLADELGKILDELGTRSPATHVIVAKPATPGNTPRPLEIYRKGIDALVAQGNKKGRRISSIDLAGLANDGVHFTEEGYRGMGKRWFDEIVRVAAGPIRLHPDNPHYFLFRGKPTILITSGEHYGAVLNADFDCVPYLDELQRHGLNLTRTFSGTYREFPKSIAGVLEKNTLAPTPARFVSPWPRSNMPGAMDGGAKFDLDQWNPDYFRRLKDFVVQAGQRGIVVELVLFCSMYDGTLWSLSPLRAENNLQKVGSVTNRDSCTLKDKDLVAVQEKLVRKIVAELAPFDNVYYEICNEVYWANGNYLPDDHTQDWQDRIAATIVDAEKRLPFRHLIAQNYANVPKKIEKPNPHVSIFNFHYAGPAYVKANYDHKKVIAYDETGFRGTADLPYRTAGWEFILAGGAVYDNLEWSFAVGHEAGTLALPDKAPGGGGESLRKQLGILRKFIHRFDFVRMRPDDTSIVKGLATGTRAQVLAEEGKQYALYLRGGDLARLEVKLPPGSYREEWLNTKTGAIDKKEEWRHTGGNKALTSPPYAEDIALSLRKAGD